MVNSLIANKTVNFFYWVASSLAFCSVLQPFTLTALREMVKAHLLFFFFPMNVCFSLRISKISLMLLSSVQQQYIIWFLISSLTQAVLLTDSWMCIKREQMVGLPFTSRCPSYCKPVLWNSSSPSKLVLSSRVFHQTCPSKSHYTQSTTSINTGCMFTETEVADTLMGNNLCITDQQNNLHHASK